MKLKYFLKRKLNIHTGYLILIILITIFVIGGYFSYALFTTSNESKGALNIVTGNLYAFIDSTDLDSDKEVVVAPGEVRVVNMDLVNVNGRDAKLNLFYKATSSNIQIGYLKSGEDAPTQSGVVLGANGTNTERKKIKVRILNNDTQDVTVTFGASAGLTTADLAFPSDKAALGLVENNIIDAYTYNPGGSAELDSTKCITGEEETCQRTDCYKDKNANTCPVGTIVRYMVNDDTMKYFYVLHDDGDVMTLQQRENTVYNTSWYIDTDSNTNLSDNTKGPITVLSVLEDITKDWSNVNDQTYTMGTTNFNNTNAFTGCSDSSCTTNSYTLAERVAKARMLTLQEALALGCTTAEKTCPIWMNNYLNNSTTYGGVNDDNTDEKNFGYWTMSTTSSTIHSYVISSSGNIGKQEITDSSFGARAVVVVNKED